MMDGEDDLPLTEVFSAEGHRPQGVSTTSGIAIASCFAAEGAEGSSGLEDSDTEAARLADRHHGGSSLEPLLALGAPPAVDTNAASSGESVRPAPTLQSLATTVDDLCHQVAHLRGRLDAADDRAHSRAPRTPTAEDSRLTDVEYKQRALAKSFSNLQAHWDSYKSVMESRDGVRAEWLNSLQAQVRALQASVAALQAAQLG